ncbi:MotA/TolQ/ExbB proton channel family protein [Carboxylicivirga sp. N1Y90]|uniref:MotA/TolQ/ExbB proton channel family protein n=1 Tax=Carboxylicivirga fragile TaxID=3417571 RepID=UPI003D328837|nr:MotA/TolQ/ExbB proton channel family protein [Marinilabiliaceae bacterium N1Y90]
MKDLFITGGSLFMSILSLLFITMVVWLIYHFAKANNSNVAESLQQLKYGKSIGLFALIMGILGQLIGFYEAFSILEQVESISPAMIYGGLKVSMITTLYGILIYLCSLILWFIFSLMLEKKK